MGVDIAIFLPSLRAGGAERSMITLSREFMRRGLRVDLVASTPGDDLRAEVPAEVRVVSLGAPRVSASLPGLVRYLRRERPRTMLSAIGHMDIAAIVARDIAGLDCPIVVTVRTTLSRAAAAAQTTRGRMVVPLARILYRRATAVVGVSHGVVDDLVQILRLDAERVRVIYNPVIRPEIFEKSKLPLRDPWFVEGEPPVVLGVGRLTAAKDYPTLLQAFAIVRGQRHARLLIIGDGEERSRLEGLVARLGLESDVRLPGFAVNPYAYMARSAVFVLSSAWEGLPGVLIEALACGAPVISTDCDSGPREILRGGQYGTLVPVGAVDELAAAIVSTLDKPRRKLPDNALSAFLPDTATNAYLECLGFAKQEKEETIEAWVARQNLVVLSKRGS